MFKSTNSSDSPKSRLRSTTIPKPKAPANIDRPLSSSRGASKPKTPEKPHRDTLVSERYTNRAYNRLPSPKERFQALASGTSNTRPPSAEKPSGRAHGRGQTPSQRPRTQSRVLAMNESRSDVTKKRPLQVERERSNTTSTIDSRVRPKTSHCPRSASSRFEDKVLLAVKDVLSRAVVRDGQIDEKNIESIINSMRSSLNFEDNLNDEEITDINVESKPSRTSVNEINVVDQNYTAKKPKPLAGIVRRDTSDVKTARKPYRKIYNQVEPLISKQSMKVRDENNEALLYVELPDLDSNSFSPRNKSNEKGMRGEPDIEAGYQDQVGDFKTKAENAFFNNADDVKLHSYIETLVRNMRDQLDCKRSMQEMEADIDNQGTICKSFCVCKVCVSRKTPSLETLKPKVSTDIEKPKSLESKSRRPTKIGQNKNVDRNSLSPNRLRLLKPSAKDGGTDSRCTVLKNMNPNFKHDESSLNTSLLLPSDVKGTSYTVIAPGENAEANEDMYLQRRISKVPVKNLSKRIR